MLCIVAVSIVAIVIGVQRLEAREAKKFVKSLSSEEACITRWQRSTMKSHFTPKGGCVVQIKEGVWVPENTVRFDQ